MAEYPFRSMADDTARSGTTLAMLIGMTHPCTCCNSVYPVDTESTGEDSYCDRCEVAYLEFKLKLLAVVYRRVMRKADEV